MKGIQSILDKLAANEAKAKAAKIEKECQRSLIAEVAKLPTWSDSVRAVPNGMLRSALFGAIGKGRRKYLERERIAAIEGIEISYTGQRLDQGDLDVWESVLHAVRAQELGRQCHITSYALLKLMGKTDSGKNRAALQTRIERLRANAVTIKQGRFTYIGGLIDEAYKDENTQAWIIVVNAKLQELYAADQFTQIDWAVRHSLDGKPLAQWLHGFYATHVQPYPMKVQTLLKLSGSENSSSSSARQTLRKALNAVSEASSHCEQNFSYKIHNELVFIEKDLSKTQQKHLITKSEK